MILHTLGVQVGLRVAGFRSLGPRPLYLGPTVTTGASRADGLYGSGFKACWLWSRGLAFDTRLRSCTFSSGRFEDAGCGFRMKSQEFAKP